MTQCIYFLKILMFFLYVIYLRYANLCKFRLVNCQQYTDILFKIEIVYAKFNFNVCRKVSI